MWTVKPFSSERLLNYDTIPKPKERRKHYKKLSYVTYYFDYSHKPLSLSLSCAHAFIRSVRLAILHTGAP